MYRSADGDGARSGSRFVRNYLREDGIFVLRMVEANADSMMVKELVQHLWDNFQTRDAAFSMELTEEVTVDEDEEVKQKDEGDIQV